MSEQKMVGSGDNADPKMGEKKMVGEDSVWTVGCLRGRLLAERVASKNAKEEAEILGHKLMELENLIKQEAKSRNKAEKKLKFLLNKLESLNISYTSDESEHWCFGDKSEISSASSSASSRTKGLQETNNNNQQIKVSEIFSRQKSAEFPTESNDLQQDHPQLFLQSRHCYDMSSDEGSLMSSAFEARSPEMKGERVQLMSENVEPILAKNSCADDTHSEKSSHMSSNQYYNDSKMDENSDICTLSVRSSYNQEDNDEEREGVIDNSMAIVPIKVKAERIDPQVLDNTVREVLDDLRRAKEQLQSSMERRRRNGINV